MKIQTLMKEQIEWKESVPERTRVLRQTSEYLRMF